MKKLPEPHVDVVNKCHDGMKVPNQHNSAAVVASGTLNPFKNSSFKLKAQLRQIILHLCSFKCTTYVVLLILIAAFVVWTRE